ncbi:MAG: hypothetical protein WC449_05495 [Candidatus Paceibacterota bacterium]
MRKRIAILAITFLLVFGLVAESAAFAKTLIKTGPITLANCHISTIGGFIDGTAGVLNSADNIGQWVEIVDSAGKRVVAYIKSIGTGETTGADALSGWNLTVGWSATGAAITDANTFTNGGTTGSVYYPNLLTYGALYKVTVDWTPSQGTVNLTNGSDVVYYSGDQTDVYLTCTSSRTWKVTNIDTANGQTCDIVTQQAVLVTAPSVNGVILSSTPYGTQGVSYAQSGFNYNDAAGYTYYIYSSGSNIAKSGTVAVFTAKVDSTATNCFADLGAGIFTGFTGSDSAFRRYKLILVDSAGKSMSAWIGAADAAEGLDVERNKETDFSNAGNWTAAGGWSVAGGKGAALNATSGDFIKSNPVATHTVYALYKMVCTIDSITDGGISMGLGLGTPNNRTSAATYTEYYTPVYVSTTGNGIKAMTTGVDASVDDYSIKRVLHSSVNGVHLFSTPGYSTTHTRSYATMDSGFNPSLALSYKIVDTQPDLGELVYSATCAYADFVYAYNVGGSMVDCGSTIDIARFAGTDAGLTSYLVVLEDSDGDVIYGSIGAAGAGAAPTLSGAELLTNNGFEDADAAAPPNWEYDAPYYTIDGITNTCVAVDADAGGNNCCEEVTAVTTEGMLYYGEITVSNHVGGTHSLTPLSIGTGYTTLAGDGTMSAYSTLISSADTWFLFVVGANTGDADFDNASLQQVTDVTHHGVHIHSTKNNTDFTWGCPQGSFYPMMGTTIKVRVYRSY